MIYSSTFQWKSPLVVFKASCVTFCVVNCVFTFCQYWITILTLHIQAAHVSTVWKRRWQHRLFKGSEVVSELQWFQAWRGLWFPPPPIDVTPLPAIDQVRTIVNPPPWNVPPQPPTSVWQMAAKCLAFVPKSGLCLSTIASTSKYTKPVASTELSYFNPKASRLHCTSQRCRVCSAVVRGCK